MTSETLERNANTAKYKLQKQYKLSQNYSMQHTSADQQMGRALQSSFAGKT